MVTSTGSLSFARVVPRFQPATFSAISVSVLFGVVGKALLLFTGGLVSL